LNAALNREARTSSEQSGDVRKSETAQAGVGTQTPRDGSIPSAALPPEVGLVQLIWDDACHQRTAKNCRALKMMSFGMLLKNDETGVVLAQSQSEHGEFIDCLFVPRSLVVCVSELPLPEGQGLLK
jgi:hypothetical protein